MRLLVADKFSERHLGALRELGLDVAYKPELGAGDLPANLDGVAVLVVRSTEVGAPAIDAAKALTLIVRAGAGVNTIDRQAASKRGIFVANCPGKNAIAVAELVFALLTSIDRRVPEQVAELRAGKWNKKEYGKADGLYGRTFGVIGTGNIGREAIARARGFGMPVVAWSRSLDAAAARLMGAELASSPEDVARRADVISLHLALTKETRGMLGAPFFAACRKNAILINTARAEIVDAAALEAAVRGGLRAGLDVHHGEPDGGTGTYSSPLLGLPGVYGTHHVGASTAQAEAAIADEAVRIVRSFVQRGEVPNCVNLAHASAAKWQLVVQHLDRVGVLANVLGALRRHDINVEEMDNQIFEGAVAACATIRLGSEPPAGCLDEIRGHEEILHAALIPLRA
jgi:D-3-phosphoglycerate dehydrogenase